MMAHETLLMMAHHPGASTLNVGGKGGAKVNIELGERGRAYSNGVNNKSEVKFRLMGIVDQKKVSSLPRFSIWGRVPKSRYWR